MCIFGGVAQKGYNKVALLMMVTVYLCLFVDCGTCTTAKRLCIFKSLRTVKCYLMMESLTPALNYFVFNF